MKRLLTLLMLSSATTYLQAALPEDIAAKEAAVAELRKAVEPLIEPLLLKNTDVRVFASLSPLADAIAELSNRSEDQRTIRMQSTDRKGKFWSSGSWCHSYVELDDSDSMRATGILSDMKGSIAPDGSLLLSNRATVNGKVQVKFQFMGRRVPGPFGIGNVCPPGGGVGSSIGVNFEKVVDLGLVVAFKQAPDGRSLSYTAAFTRPDSISVTAQIGLGPIGTIGHPMSFDLPKTPIASGIFPLLITNEGTFKLPGGAGERAYIFALTPVAFSSTQQGIQASWKSAVQFKAPANASADQLSHDQ
jgi:hypothetical protein